PRSTVGTITEIYDFLRVLYAHLGERFDPQTGKKIKHLSKEEIVEQILALPQGTKIVLLTPVFFQKKESFEALVERLNREGFLRIRLNGEIYALDEKIPFEPFRKNELHLVLDRLLVEEK